jgi:hypothetical protein
MDIELFLRGFLGNFGFVMLVLAVVIASVRAIGGKRFFEELFRWSLLLPAGANGIFTAGTHIFMPEFCAQEIGWPDSPFQYEVGVADLAIGVLGVMAFWSNSGFRLAAAIAAIILYGGDAIGHVYQMVVAENYQPGNAGSWFWMDVGLPIILIVCLAMGVWRKDEDRGEPVRWNVNGVGSRWRNMVNR